MAARAVLAGVLLACGALPLAAESGQSELAGVEVVGGVSLTAETIEYYLGVAEGDPYDSEAVARGFRKLWDSGLVEDLRIDEEVVEPGKVKLIVTLRERPRVAEFAFEGNKKLSTSTIKEKLDTAGILLKRNVPLRTSEIQRFRQAILDVYAKEGYASAIVETVITETAPNQKRVAFKMDEGAKVRIGKILFEGNEVFPPWRLHHAMKKLKQRSLLFQPFGKKLIWNREAWGEDGENIKKLYMNHGYKDIIVGEPRVDLQARNPGGRTQKEKKFRMVVTIPLQEGQQFRMGNLTLDGLTVFKPEPLRKLYETKPGKVYNQAKIEQGNESIKTLYHSRGYIYAYTSQQLTEQPGDHKVVDVAVSVFEGDRYRLGRLEFAGNTKTQDRVLRREFRLFEGDWMDMGAFRRSVFKVNQLGYFKLKEDPLEFKFDEASKLVNVTVKGEEVGRTDIQFGAGYSELDGLFGQFMFNTRNFLGRGETLGLSASFGRRADNYQLSFSEPYFLDRRMVIGASIYKQKVNLDQTVSVQQYFRDSKGASLVWGLGVGDFGQLSVSYGWEDVWARYNQGRTFNSGEGPEIPHRPPVTPPYTGMPTPELFFQVYKGVTSSLTPSYGVDSRDDPFDPSSGMSFFSRLRYAGGPVLGGDFNYLRPEVGYALFLPVRRRYVAALNLEGGYIHPYGGKDIPYYDRYRMGGERSLRGFAYLSVLPRKSNGDYFFDANGATLGGDRYVQLNLEYQIKLGGPLKFIFFFDAGNTWVADQGWDFSNIRKGTGAELRIFLPIFQAPLRFIYGVNLDPYKDEKKSDFTFSIGTTF